LLGLVPATGGQVFFRGNDITGRSARSMRRIRTDMQMVFQDPHASLNPSMDIETAVGHPLRIHGVTRGADERHARVVEALERVGLAPAERFLSKYPSDLSGGQKQRAVMARAIILGPELLVADEPVSMLDMSVRAKILQLMLDLRRDLDLTYVYITHDLATAKFFCDRIAIMYLGRIVEIGDTAEIFADPKHPYTRSLLRAIPEPDPDRSVARDLPRGEVPDAARPPLGCSFHPRCPNAFEVCGWETRDLRSLLEERWLQLEPEEYEREKDIFGDLSVLDEPGLSAKIPASRGHTGAEIASELQAIRDSDPDERLWKGVREVRVEDDGVAVDFFDAIDPKLGPAGGVQVACHLHNPELMREADRRSHEQDIEL
jgi:peptide/nickel transport system ATP-binding protein